MCCSQPLNLCADYLAGNQLDASSADVADVDVLAVGTDHLQTFQQCGRYSHHLNDYISADAVGQLKDAFDSRIGCREVDHGHGVSCTDLHR